jgi:hypothetical protein
VVTRAQQAGLRVEDVARRSLEKRARLYRLDAQVRAALTPGQASCAKTTRRAKAKNGPT